MDFYIEITKFILTGVGVTLQIYVVTLVLSTPLGIICALGKLSRFKVLQGVLWLYTWVFRGTPLLLQMFFIYYGLPIATDRMIQFDSMTAACVAFVINYTAYFTEIFRAGIQSIGKGQYEAAKALGMSPWLTMKRIILPQATKVILPPFGNEAITLVKDTALCFAIALPEILKNTQRMVAKYFAPEAYIIAAIIYLLLTFVVVQIFRYLEKRYDYGSN